MRDWYLTSRLILLGGIAVRTVYFFGLYAIGKIDPRIAETIALTQGCFAAPFAVGRA